MNVEEERENQELNTYVVSKLQCFELKKKAKIEILGFNLIAVNKNYS